MKNPDLLIAMLLACSCCDSEKERHLRCVDEDENVVVDTKDLFHAPRQYEGAWSWENKDRTEYNEISVPPHKCVYKETRIDKDASKLLAEKPEG